MTERAILHIDMNNFYASVECMLNPDLKPHPIAVCGSQEERHGIVLAKNYAAKAKGVSTGSHMASQAEMPRPCYRSPSLRSVHEILQTRTRDIRKIYRSYRTIRYG